MSRGAVAVMPLFLGTFLQDAGLFGGIEQCKKRASPALKRG